MTTLKTESPRAGGSRRNLARAAFLASAVSAASGAHAGDLSEADDARSTMRRVVSCAVYDNMEVYKGEGVLAALAGDFGGKAYARLYANVESCLRQTNYQGRWVGKLQFTRPLLRGEIFRSVVSDGWGRSDKKQLLPALRRLANAPRDASSDPIGAFGKCVAKLDPENARKAIGPVTADYEESAAYAALSPSMAQCVAPGQKISFSKQILEGALAEGLFVLTFATPANSSVERPN